ncbi:uncharacterized protein LOC128229374 isoform X2 [Mya arenaria]|uniref:uncharacterized protein LOC128229374 isoform X2 n=1 Tax=Mya arenaria TaxID=6604 RepID=UPI0022DEB65D|nr:uncharacterized protein LOC128229374 isoform X2 [Mya arenaria]
MSYTPHGTSQIVTGLVVIGNNITPAGITGDKEDQTMQSNQDIFQDGALISDIESHGRVVISHMVKHLVTSVKERLDREIFEETLGENGDGCYDGPVDSYPTKNDDIGNEAPTFKDGAAILALDASGQAVLRAMIQNLVQGVALSLKQMGSHLEEAATQATDTVALKDCNVITKESKLVQRSYGIPNVSNGVKTKVNAKDEDTPTSNSFVSHNQEANVEKYVPKVSEEISVFKSKEGENSVSINKKKSGLPVFKNIRRKQKRFRLRKWFSGKFSCCGSQKTED